MVNTWSFELGINHYVLPSQCEHVFYSEVLRRGGWSFFVRYDPRGRLVKYNVVEEDDIEEKYDAEEQVHVLEEVDEEVKLDLGDDVLQDDINDDIIENDVDDDDDVANRFNIDFELDDTPGEELDGEEDQVH
jgi:hypothetical protein